MEKIKISVFFFSAIILVAIMHPGEFLDLTYEEVFPGADQKTSSRSFFFDWISSQYEGSTEEETLIKLDFFKWLHDEYGMALDIYSLDVGNIDDGPYTAGVGRLFPNHWGTLDSEEFRAQFPRGFDPIYEKAKSFGCRLGIWMGPDGFGDTPDEEKARADMLIRFCRDYNFFLFKVDAVAGQLRSEKQAAFIRTIKKCREYTPDLIVANHRVDLGEAAPYATTYLWEGAETYIDVFSNNSQTAAHHRVGAISRALPPGLNRLMEDHGVCLSSCLDFWEDDLVLQAFNRNLLLSPEIYGNPWLLRDDEFPKLARIFNLHHKYRDILIDGIMLPEKDYGPHAVSRGDARMRFLSLRNLTWDPVNYRIQLDDTIGLKTDEDIELRRFHPSERIIGRFKSGTSVEVEVLPFRSCLLMATAQAPDEIGLAGCDYEVVRDVPGKPVIIRLLGFPASRAHIKLMTKRKFSGATLAGRNFPQLLNNNEVVVNFPGNLLKKRWHRRLGGLRPCEVPTDAESLYEATCFAGDSNALEVRSLLRSGPTRIPQVKKARQAFFDQPMFVNRGIWDRNLFDGDMNTFFIARLEARSLRIDFGESVKMDRLVIKIRSKYEHDINPRLHCFSEDNLAEVSLDLKAWIPVGQWGGKGTIAIAKIPAEKPIRYVRIRGAPRRIAEVKGYRDGMELDRSRWRASNLFFSYTQRPAKQAWSASFELDEIQKGSYLAVALNGQHGDEGAYAAMRIDNIAFGAPDRAVSYPSNTWEYYNVREDSNYTYYFPLSENLVGKKIDVVVLVMDDGMNNFQPEVYLTAHPIPFETKKLILFE